MKIFDRIRGPRLGTKLLLWGLVLIIVPWISYRQLLGMERLLIQGQSQAQLLTAEGISTLFNGRDDLFNDLPVSIQDYESLYARPLQNPIHIDGRVSDWGPITDRFLKFGIDASGQIQDGGFELVLGERAGQLYGFMRIKDDVRLYRNPEYLRLDTSDQIRLNFIRSDGEDGRILLTFTGPGVTTAYAMDADWRFALPGPPENRVQGAVEETPEGLTAEFRMPLDMLGSRRFFGVAYVDVDDPVTRAVRSVAQTLPKAGKTSFNLVVLRSPEVLKIIQGLGYSGARILVIDREKRVRAETGTFKMAEGVVHDAGGWSATTRRWVDVLRPVWRWLAADEPSEEALDDDDRAGTDQVIASSLEGNPIALRRRMPGGQQIIMAAHPIVSRDTVLGTVVVEQNIDQILAFQREALEQVIVLSVASLLVVFVVLLAFAGRLAWRIRQLRREATAAIDQHGRLRANALQSEIDAGDEIGDLARSVSGMLTKLQQHNQFLEGMPRTLRHEINNPLNTVSTSIDNLTQENPEIADSTYLASAKRGVMRIGAIVQNLADAANLEEALESEELEIVDINKLLANYVENCSRSHKGTDFVYRGVSRPVLARVSDYRIEQLLDKIVDNAVDFHRSNSPIKVQLDVFKDYLRITVANRGPTLPPESEASLFDSMVSHRGAESQNRLHFGLGLYVVRVIAEYHGGTVRAMNLADGSGVALLVQLPLANAPRPVEAAKAQPNGAAAV